jgi:hypothetical protein
VFRVERRTPFGFDGLDFGAATLRHVHHASSEHTVDADQHGVSGFDEVHEARLHTGATGPRHRQRQAIFRLKQLAQHGHILVHDFQKLGIEMPDNGKRKGLKYAVVHRTWPRPEQCANWRIGFRRYWHKILYSSGLT